MKRIAGKKEYKKKEYKAVTLTSVDAKQRSRDIRIRKTAQTIQIDSLRKASLRNIQGRTPNRVEPTIKQRNNRIKLFINKRNSTNPRWRMKEKKNSILHLMAVRNFQMKIHKKNDPGNNFKTATYDPIEGRIYKTFAYWKRIP
jgi:hypothetical protein